MPFHIFEDEARSILTPVSGFLREAGFTHSLNPARNCTFGCSYCYVPTMRVQAGLRPEDWMHWGQQTTFKTNAAELLARSLRSGQIIYCSPLTDPYQPAEADRCLMPDILRVVASTPSGVRFVIQTRGPLILRDIDLLRSVRVGFSVTTDREDVRRIFEPHCAPIEERWRVIRTLRDAGIPVFATLAPILPCNPEAIVGRALEETNGAIIADPFHVREVKKTGATTRPAAIEICRRHGWADWLDPEFQKSVLARMRTVADSAGRRFDSGPSGFGLLCG
ncbi:MAG TPA: radical SAM protein [Bryobacteraceae bacterium]|nr:radical SAM protein [Bryobacteraceae bacterium]